MSVHSDLMKSASELLFAVQGDAGASGVAVLYKPEVGRAFVWSGSIVGAERGGIEETDGGDLLKVFRMLVTGPTSVLTRNKITQIERTGTVQIGTQVWAIDVPESSWGPEIVRLGLIRRIVTQKESMEAQDAALR